MVLETSSSENYTGERRELDLAIGLQWCGQRGGGGREGDFPKQPTSIARSSSALHQLITVSQVMNGPVELFVFSVVCLALQLHLVVLLLLVVVITLIYLNKASFFPLVLIFPFEIPKMVHLDDNHISRSPNCS